MELEGVAFHPTATGGTGIGIDRNTNQNFGAQRVPTPTSTYSGTSNSARRDKLKSREWDLLYLDRPEQQGNHARVGRPLARPRLNSPQIMDPRRPVARAESPHLLQQPGEDGELEAQIKTLNRYYFTMCAFFPPAFLLIGYGYLDGHMQVYTTNGCQEFAEDKKQLARFLGFSSMVVLFSGLLIGLIFIVG